MSAKQPVQKPQQPSWEEVYASRLERHELEFKKAKAMKEAGIKPDPSKYDWS